MPTYLGFEIIDMTALNVDRVGRRGGILTARYAGDYRDSINVDPPGVRSGWRFMLSAGGAWLDDAVRDPVAGVSAFEYYTEFFNDRIDAGNEPFIIEWQSKYWLVDLVNPEWGAEVHTADLFTAEGLEVRRRSVAGVDWNSDGSMVKTEPVMLVGGGDQLLGDGEELFVMTIV